MKMRDIDTHLDTSGVVKLIELKKQESERRLSSFLKSDGTAKAGKASAVRAACQSINAADTVLCWIEQYLESVED